ncbi:hypothetical protein FACS189472_16640 [Alphaproteobacteria bacterium]|nr:hypothetical protein FACS189472_16640 [Alphaproteobacteria bacterium]
MKNKKIRVSFSKIKNKKIKVKIKTIMLISKNMKRKQGHADAHGKKKGKKGGKKDSKEGVCTEERMKGMNGCGNTPPMSSTVIQVCRQREKSEKGQYGVCVSTKE